MNFMSDHASMTSEEIRQAFVEFLNGRVDFSELPMTPENLNWMIAVYALDDGLAETADDLLNLLAAMNKHYAGPISVHEGWGGAEADSNQELITEKINFNLRENIEGHNALTTLAAIELGWIFFGDYAEILIDASTSINLVSAENLVTDERIKINYYRNDDGVIAFVYGKTEESRYKYVERAYVTCEESVFTDLYRMLHVLRPSDHAAKCAFVRAWFKGHGEEFKPYSA